MAIGAPRRLRASDSLDTFQCGEPVLDRLLREHALASTRSASTYVLADEDGRVLAYYCLSAGALLRRAVPGSASARRGLPETVPVILLGRLAVDQRYQGRGLGADLLQDALLRALASSREVAAHGLLVHALNARSVAFYQRWGFTPCRDHPLTLMVPLRVSGAGLFTD